MRLWDVDIGHAGEKAPLDGYPANLVVAALSRDGGTLAGHPAIGGRLGVWNTSRGGRPLSLSARKGVTAALSPDERRVAEGGLDGAVRLQTFASGNQTRILQSSSHPIRKVAFSPDGRLLASAGRPLAGKSGIDVWRISDHGHPAPVEGPYRTSDRLSPEGGLAISPDGRRLAGARSDHNVVIWDLNGKEPPRTLTGHRSGVEELTFSTDGRLLAGIAYDGRILIWKTSGETKPLATLQGSPSLIRKVVFSPDGRWLATTEPDGTARLWRTTGSTESLVLKGFGSSIARLAFGPGGRLVFALRRPSEDAVRIWRCEVCGPGDQVLVLAKQRLA